MTYKFTKGAKNAIEYANEVTLKLGHEYIGTEHILYGLAKEKTGIASKVLEGQNITADAVYAQIEEIIGPGKLKSRKILGFTPRTKKILENASNEAKKLNSDFIGTEHILTRNFKRRRQRCGKSFDKPKCRYKSDLRRHFKSYN